jgi:NAD(P)-dependent dehydrogenase (short-subunit alcohol dehydrogenase family)
VLDKNEATGVRTAVLDRIRQSSREDIGSGRVAHKVGIVTGVGPTSGIGTFASRLFAREGARALYLLDLSDALPGFAADLQKTFPGTKVTWVRGDAADEATVKGIVERAVKEQGKLDFYFANAGISNVRPKEWGKFDPNSRESQAQALAHGGRRVDAIPVEEFMEIQRVNVLSGFLALKYAAPAMQNTAPAAGKRIPGGSIVLTASVAGRLANAGSLPYSASKAAVVSMAQTGAYEYAGYNIRVNAICPGLIQTDMTAAVFAVARANNNEGATGQINPLLRHGLPVEIAHAALWLVSDDASYVNGQPIPVDGGLTAYCCVQLVGSEVVADRSSLAGWRATGCGTLCGT